MPVHDALYDGGGVGVVVPASEGAAMAAIPVMPVLPAEQCLYRRYYSATNLIRWRGGALLDSVHDRRDHGSGFRRSSALMRSGEVDVLAQWLACTKHSLGDTLAGALVIMAEGTTVANAVRLAVLVDIECQLASELEPQFTTVANDDLPCRLMLNKGAPDALRFQAKNPCCAMGVVFKQAVSLQQFIAVTQ